MRTPAWAPRPTPTMIDIGVARPSAHGQAMISTATAATMAKVKRGSGPNTAQAMNAITAASITAGTNQPATWSASRWIGAATRWAAATIWTIWASRVSRPTLSARITKPPVWLRVPPMTFAPAALVTGMDSPVTMDSSSDERPSSSMPSTGTFSPGRTRRRSPTRDGVERDLLVAAVGAHPARGLRREVEQGADRARGLVAGAQLQHLPEQHQHRDHGGRFEVDGDGAAHA